MKIPTKVQTFKTRHMLLLRDLYLISIDCTYGFIAMINPIRNLNNLDDGLKPCRALMSGQSKDNHAKRLVIRKVHSLTDSDEIKSEQSISDCRFCTSSRIH